MDRPSYRDARTHLKMEKLPNTIVTHDGLDMRAESLLCYMKRYLYRVSEFVIE